MECIICIPLCAEGYVYPYAHFTDASYLQTWMLFCLVFLLRVVEDLEK